MDGQGLERGWLVVIEMEIDLGCRAMEGRDEWCARLPREEGLGEAGSDAHEVPRLRVGITRERRLALVHGAHVVSSSATL
jgi:hypothetical protein